VGTRPSLRFGRFAHPAALLRKKHAAGKFARYDRRATLPRVAAGQRRVGHSPPGEQRVTVTGIKRGRIWRQLTSCAVAYLFALQLVLVGFIAPAIAASAADGDALAAAVCLHDAGAPLAPADKGGDEHCKFCTAGSHQVFTAPALAHNAIVRAAQTAPAPASDDVAPPTRAHASAQPRGPPPTA
jgi:hypothetical protein